ncbi:hypothetical protein [Flavobacterium sp. T12S277]|uniref:hypothetical protein n=1 Tax=Flavobacterium sp. T12S277 TaxID=3402752 RepID=UPI003AE2EDDB
MRNYIVLFTLIFTTISFAQTITSKKEDATPAQYALLEKVNQYYPDITLSKTVTNFKTHEKNSSIIDSRKLSIVCTG